MDSIRAYQELQREYANNLMDISASAATTSLSDSTNIGKNSVHDSLQSNNHGDVGLNNNGSDVCVRNSNGGFGETGHVGTHSESDTYALSVLNEAVRIFESYPCFQELELPSGIDTNPHYSSSSRTSITSRHVGTLKYLYLARAQLHADEGRLKEAEVDIYKSLTACAGQSAPNC